MVAAAVAVVAAACSAAPASPLLDPASGGAGGTDDRSTDAFSRPSSLLSTDETARFRVGNDLFTEPWTPPGEGAPDHDGLGPLFNARSCAECHVLDGRARPRSSAEDVTPGLVLRWSSHDGTGWGPVPGLGTQLQDRAVSGSDPEGRLVVTYEEVPGTFDDGMPFTLRAPSYDVVLTVPASRPDELLISPRVAPAVFGAGLLEAIPDAALLASADPDDRDGDGISGRVGRDAAGDVARFGWKATERSVRSQVETALARDIGISGPATPGAGPEATSDQVDLLAFYTATVAVPDRRGVDEPDVERGGDVFVDVGCDVCHTPTLVTGPHEITALAQQTIHPYTDLLLHDMGPGLADGRPDGAASGSEWRTPPLWGIGLQQRVNGHTFLLHDGRARDLTEAILWHGGEAEPTREAFRALDGDERADLLRFLESL